MVVSHFLKWIYTARVTERAAAAAALARAFIDSDLPFEDRCAAEAALTLLLDDPSSKVRLAMAEALSMSRHAPLQIISALASDQPEVAGLVSRARRLLTDSDLIDRVASGHACDPENDRRPAGRFHGRCPPPSPRSARRKPARHCCAMAALDIAGLSFRRMAERHGHVGAGARGDDRRPRACLPTAGTCCWSSSARR